MTKVRWTDVEWADVTRRAAELIVYDQLGRLAALNQAAAELPEHRRRVITTITGAPEYVRRLPHEIERQKTAMSLERASAHIPPAPTPAPAPAADPLAGAMTEALAALVLRVMESPNGQAVIAAAIDTALARKRAARDAEVAPPPAAADGTPRPRVLIVGLVGVQAASIHQDFSSRAELHFVRPDETRERMRSQAISADIVIGMTAFLERGAHKTLAEAHPGYSQVSGGGSELRRVLSIKLERRRQDHLDGVKNH